MNSLFKESVEQEDLKWKTSEQWKNIQIGRDCDCRKTYFQSIYSFTGKASRHLASIGNGGEAF